MLCGLGRRPGARLARRDAAPVDTSVPRMRRPLYAMADPPSPASSSSDLPPLKSFAAPPKGPSSTPPKSFVAPPEA
eukprot:1353900-Prymnesium_polylepis.1